MAENQKRTIKESVRHWMNTHDTEQLYLILQFVFWAVMCALLMMSVQYIATLIPLIYGALLLLLSLNAKRKLFRVIVRAVPFILFAVLAVMLVGDFITKQDVSGIKPFALLTSERIAFTISYLITVVFPMLLTTLPAWIVTAFVARRQTDTVLLHLAGWTSALFALGTLCLYFYHETVTGFLIAFGNFSFFIFSVDTLLWLFLIASIAFAFTTYMLYPFGKQRIKRAVEAARAKLPAEDK